MRFPRRGGGGCVRGKGSGVEGGPQPGVRELGGGYNGRGRGGEGARVSGGESGDRRGEKLVPVQRGRDIIGF